MKNGLIKNFAKPLASITMECGVQFLAMVATFRQQQLLQQRMLYFRKLPHVQLFVIVPFYKKGGQRGSAWGMTQKGDPLFMEGAPPRCPLLLLCCCYFFADFCACQVLCKILTNFMSALFIRQLIVDGRWTRPNGHFCIVQRLFCKLMSFELLS